MTKSLRIFSSFMTVGPGVNEFEWPLKFVSLLFVPLISPFLFTIILLLISLILSVLSERSEDLHSGNPYVGPPLLYQKTGLSKWVASCHG